MMFAFVDEHGIPPAEEGHNITYGHTRMGVCARCGSLQIERLDHDCFDFDSVWDQYEWYTLDAADLPFVRGMLKDCPNPLDPVCQCAAHRDLRTECSRLPSSAWASALEADRHVHRLRLSTREGRLHLEPAGASPANPLTGG